MRPIPRSSPTHLPAVALAALLASLPQLALAADYVVDGGDPQASDGNDGSASAPWATIQHAADVVSPGDTVTVLPGQYGRVTLTTSGSSDSPIVFTGAQAVDRSLVDEGAVFEPANPTQVPANPGANAVTGGFVVQADHLRIARFEITQITGRGGVLLDGVDGVEIVDNFLHDLNPDPQSYDYIGIRANGHDNINVTVRGNVLYRVQGTGIGIMGQGWLVEDNELSHGLDTNTDSGVEVGGDSDAFRFFGSGHVIRNNYVHDYLDEEQTGDPHIDCFQTFSVNPDSQYAFDVLVEGNLCDNMGQMLMSEDQSEATGGENAVHDLTFRNNVFRRARAVSIIVSEYNDHFTFANNVVTEGYYIGISVSDNSHHVTVLNNIFYNNYEADPDSRRGQALTDETCKPGSEWDYNIHYPDFTWPEKQPEYDGHGQFGADPSFVDAPGGDYHLSTGSPAIDQAVVVPGFDYDKDGVLRPQGEGWDIGAYEWCDGGCVGGAGGVGGSADGGAGGAGGSTSSSGTSMTSTTDEESGCGCRLGPGAGSSRSRPGGVPWWLLAVALAAVTRRGPRLSELTPVGPGPVRGVLRRGCRAGG